MNFVVTLNTATGEAGLAEMNSAVFGIEKSYRLKNSWAVRVLLKNQP